MLRTLITTLLLVAAVGAVGTGVLREVFENTIVVEPFAVPEELIADGYTPVVVANRIRDEMRETLDTPAFEAWLPDDAEGVDAPVPVVGISIRTLATYVRETLLEIPRRRVSGDVTFVPAPTTDTSAALGSEDSHACRPSNTGRHLHLVIRYAEGGEALKSTLLCPVSQIERLLAEGGRLAGYMTAPLLFAREVFEEERQREPPEFTETKRATAAALHLTEGMAQALVYDLEARVRLAEGDEEGAIERFQSAAAIASEVEDGTLDRAEMHFQWSFAEERRGDVGAAVAQLRRARTIAAETEDPERVEFLLDAASRFTVLGAHDEAKAAVLQAKDVRGRSGAEQLAIGSWLRHFGDYEDALLEYESALAAGGLGDELNHGLSAWAATMRLLDRGETAARDLKAHRFPAGVEIEDGSLSHMYAGAALASGLDEWEAARLEFNRMANGPAGSLAKALTARALLGLGQYVEAAYEAANAADLLDDNVRVLAIWTDVLIATGRFSEAMEKIERASLLDSLDDDLIFTRFFLYLMLDDMQSAKNIARESEEKLTELKREKCHGCFVKAKMLFFLGEKQSALRLFESSWRESPVARYPLLWMASVGEPGPTLLVDRVPNSARLEWPGPIMNIYNGEWTPTQLLNFVDQEANPVTRRERACDAYFFIGQFHRQRGARNAAIAAFEAAVDTGASTRDQYRGALLELRRLRAGGDVQAQPSGADP